MTVIYEKVTVIGMGLIGASIALSIRRGGLASQVIGSDHSLDVAKTVERLQITDQFEIDATIAVNGADLVIMAVPVGVAARRTNYPVYEKRRRSNRYWFNQNICIT